MAGEACVPHWRDARLAIGLVVIDHHELIDRSTRHHGVRMILRIPEDFEHHHAVGHRRVNGAQATVAIEPLGDELDRACDGAPAHRGREPRLRGAQNDVDDAEQREPARILVRRPFGRSEVAWIFQRNNSSIATPRRFLASGLRARRTRSGTMTVRPQ